MTVFFSPVENLLATCGVGVIDPVTPSGKPLMVQTIPLPDTDPLIPRGGVVVVVAVRETTNPGKVLSGGRSLHIKERYEHGWRYPHDG